MRLKSKPKVWTDPFLEAKIEEKQKSRSKREVTRGLHSVCEHPSFESCGHWAKHMEACPNKNGKTIQSRDKGGATRTTNDSFNSP